VKVLSLAWKYHPSITSGVGVACEGLNNALSKLVDLTVIYPSVSKIQVKEEIVFTSEDLSEEQIQTIYEEYIQTSESGHFELAVRLDPYFVSEHPKHQNPLTKKVEKIHTDKVQKKHFHTGKEIKTREKLLYDDVDIFGEYVKDKVFIYNRLVEELAGNIPFDIIHAHDWMTFLAGIYLKDRFHKPLVLHVHSLEYDRVGHKDVGWVYEIERYAMSKADAVIAGSQYTKGIIESSYGLSGNKIKVVYNALTPTETVKPKPLGSKNNFKVLFAGRIDGNKGLEYFIGIAKKVLGKSKDVDFILAGRGKSDVKFSRIEGFKEIKKNFHYLGFVEREELFGLYQACDVLCMPSISEPFGLTAIEAAHMGLPVILSRKTGASEILKDTPMADFWDIEQFSSYILSIKQNNKFRNKIIDQNRLAVDALSWENSALQVKKIYLDLY